MVSYGVYGAYVYSGITGVDNEVSLAGSVAYHVPMADDSPVSVSLQTGIGWINATSSALNFPVGVAIQGSTQAGSVVVRPWVMPRPVDPNRWGRYHPQQHRTSAHRP